MNRLRREEKGKRKQELKEGGEDEEAHEEEGEIRTFECMGRGSKKGWSEKEMESWERARVESKVKLEGGGGVLKIKKNL